MPSLPNVEAIVIEWLTAVAGVPVYGDKPKIAPDEFILVDRTGGARESMVLDTAEILIEVYNKDSRPDASEKANQIADIVPQLTQYESITRAKVNSVVNLDDIAGQFHRYQIYLDVYNRR